MISHKHKIIFIHIPKCAGTSITKLLFNDIKLDWKTPNYDIHYGWCPKRKIHLQHATPNQMLELDLINETTWNSYFKFTIVRNPWSRALSDYLWMTQTNNIKDTFTNYISSKGAFKEILTNQNTMNYRGDHLNKQLMYLNVNNINEINQIARFENLESDIITLLKKLGISIKYLPHYNKSKSSIKHYSHFFNDYRKKLVEEKYYEDINYLNYKFENRIKLIHKFKNYINLNNY